MGQPDNGKGFLVLALWMCAVPAIAQRLPLPPQPLPEPPLPCEAFTLNVEDDWVAKQDITVPGPNGPVQIRAGTVVDDDLQDELDDQCRK
jgi:hypothetical protein